MKEEIVTDASLRQFLLGKVDDEGMFCVDRLERGEPPETPDKMVKVTVQ